jgi:hypothetical protein
MSNEFKTIMTDMENSFTILHTCKSLGELKEKYVIFEFHREKLIEWINSNFSENEELYHTYIDKVGEFENRLFEEYGGIPVFDNDFSSDDMDDLFEDYVSYFQRYGCLNSTQIISWDKTNILLEDEIGSVEAIVRPDVLLAS